MSLSFPGDELQTTDAKGVLPPLRHERSPRRPRVRADGDAMASSLASDIRRSHPQRSPRRPRVPVDLGAMDGDASPPVSSALALAAAAFSSPSFVDERPRRELQRREVPMVHRARHGESKSKKSITAVRTVHPNRLSRRERSPLGPQSTANGDVMSPSTVSDNGNAMQPTLPALTLAAAALSAPSFVDEVHTVHRARDRAATSKASLAKVC